MDTVELACAFNDGYAELACVCITSVMENTRRHCRFHILHSGLNQKTQALVEKLEQKYAHCSIKHHKLDASCFMGFSVGSLAAETYYRLLLPDILADMEKVLYLDCDLVAEGDISTLWDIDLGEYAIGAAPDRFLDAPHLHPKARLGLLPEDVYINAGVLLMNLVRLRAIGFSEQAFGLIPRIAQKCKQVQDAFNHDQDVLNHLLKGQILELPPKMNSMSLWEYYKSDRVPVEMWAQAVQDPLIIHYAVKKPHVISRDYMPQNWRRYYHYKALSPLADIGDEERMARYTEYEAKANETAVNVFSYLKWQAEPVCLAYAERIRPKCAGKEIAFWGAGHVAGTVMVMFAAQGLKPNCLVDGLPENQGGKLFEYTVQAPEVLEGKSSEYVIVVSTLRRHVAVIETLKMWGYSKDQIFYPLQEIASIMTPL